MLGETKNPILKDNKPWIYPMKYAVNFFQETQFLDDKTTIGFKKLQFENQPA